MRAGQGAEEYLGPERIWRLHVGGTAGWAGRCAPGLPWAGRGREAGLAAGSRGPVTRDMLEGPAQIPKGRPRPRKQRSVLSLSR